MGDFIHENFVSGGASWLSMACSGGTPWTAFKTAIVVGTILVAINQGHWIYLGKWEHVPWYSIVLTYCVPYCVNTHGAVVGKMRQARLGQNLIDERWRRRLATREETAAAVDNTVAALRDSQAAYGGQSFTGHSLDALRLSIELQKQPQQLQQSPLPGPGVLPAESLRPPTPTGSAQDLLFRPPPQLTALVDEPKGRSNSVHGVSVETTWGVPLGSAAAAGGPVGYPARTGNGAAYGGSAV